MADACLELGQHHGDGLACDFPRLYTAQQREHGMITRSPTMLADPEGLVATSRANQARPKRAQVFRLEVSFEQVPEPVPINIARNHRYEANRRGPGTGARPLPHRRGQSAAPRHRLGCSVTRFPEGGSVGQRVPGADNTGWSRRARPLPQPGANDVGRGWR